MFYRYDRVIKELLKRMFGKRMLPLWLCIVGLVCVFVLITSLGKERSKVSGPEDTYLFSRSKITVAVSTGSEGFAFIDESGRLSGYDIDLVTLILSELYPDKPVEFKELSSQLASYALRSGEVDLAIGVFTKGVTKTQGLSVSSAYFKDYVYAYTAPGSGITSLSGLQGRNVLASTTELTKASLKAAFKELGLEITSSSVAAYSDAHFALDNGSADAVIAMQHSPGGYEGVYIRIDQPVTTVNFCILAWTDNGSITTLVNSKLSEYRKDGTLKQLMDKWSLSEAEE